MEILKNVNDVPAIIAHFLMLYAVFLPILSYIFSKLKYYNDLCRVVITT